jgi:cytochrome c553
MGPCFQKMRVFLTAWAFYILAMQVNAEPSSFHIQSLAASCFACHGPQGNSLGETPVLAGLNAQYFVEKMLAFRKNELVSTVMHRHAKGLNVDEINQLAQYFSEQKRVSSPAPKSQMMDTSRGY